MDTIFADHIAGKVFSLFFIQTRISAATSATHLQHIDKISSLAAILDA